MSSPTDHVMNPRSPSTVMLPSLKRSTPPGGQRTHEGGEEFTDLSMAFVNALGAVEAGSRIVVCQHRGNAFLSDECLQMLAHDLFHCSVVHYYLRGLTLNVSRSRLRDTRPERRA